MSGLNHILLWKIYHIFYYHCTHSHHTVLLHQYKKWKVCCVVFFKKVILINVGCIGLYDPVVTQETLHKFVIYLGIWYTICWWEYHTTRIDTPFFSEFPCNATITLRLVTWINYVSIWLADNKTSFWRRGQQLEEGLSNVLWQKLTKSYMKINKIV